MPNITERVEMYLFMIYYYILVCSHGYMIPVNAQVYVCNRFSTIDDCTMVFHLRDIFSTRNGLTS